MGPVLVIFSFVADDGAKLQSVWFALLASRRDYNTTVQQMLRSYFLTILYVRKLNWCAQAILVFSLIKYQPVEYGTEQYPLWADLIGWMMPLSTNLPILVVAALVVYNAQGNTILEVTPNILDKHNIGSSAHFAVFGYSLQPVANQINQH